MLNNDLISRAALLKHKSDCYDYDGHLLYVVPTGYIVNAPAVDAAPVRHGCIESSDIGPICSVCGVPIRLDQGTPNYCPHCGALLDGGETTCGPDYCEIGGGDDE